MWRMNIGAAALAALTALPALAGGASPTTSNIADEPLLGGDVTASLDAYEGSVEARLRAVNLAIARIGAADDDLASAELRMVQRAMRAVKLDVADIQRDLARLERISASRRVDLQAGIEGAFARIDVRFDALGDDVTELASALELTQTRARAAETYDPQDEDANTIAGVFLAPRTAYGVASLHRLQDLQAKVDRLEASANTSTPRAAAIQEIADGLRADLRETARSLDQYDVVRTRGQMNRVRSDVESRLAKLTAGIDAQLARFGVR